ncbi:hypothetical protein DL93DRAFT_2062219 [Clavulina sp. PMI_390]|nr:hypothetical protein DL93DRAFT_2062219 [Clavulina sp. PMI_390]
MIERGHRTWIESIWKLCGKYKNRWSRWFHAAMWADRVTTRRTTGFSPYHLLYGKPHLFPYALDEETWYTMPWHEIKSTEELLEIRARQLKSLSKDRSKANRRNIATRKDAAEKFAQKNIHRLVSGKYRPGEFVLVALKGTNIKKGYGRHKSADRWAGPFKIRARYRSGSYKLKELDGVPVRGSIPAGHLRPFYTRHDQVVGEELIIEDDTDEAVNPFEWSAEEESDKANDSPYEP